VSAKRMRPLGGRKRVHHNYGQLNSSGVA
jgi:hypothetical protein